MIELRYEISYGPDDDRLRGWLIDCQTKLPSYRASNLALAPAPNEDGTFIRQILIVIDLPEDQAVLEVEERLRRNGLVFKKV